jgi:hypothetical protein
VSAVLWKKKKKRPNRDEQNRNSPFLLLVEPSPDAGLIVGGCIVPKPAKKVLTLTKTNCGGDNDSDCHLVVWDTAIGHNIHCSGHDHRSSCRATEPKTLGVGE